MELLHRPRRRRRRVPCVTRVELHLFTGEGLPRLDPYLRTNKRKIGLTAPRDERVEGDEDGSGCRERNKREREERRAIMRN